MSHLLNEADIIETARDVLLLLEAGQYKKANQRIKEFDSALEKRDTSDFSADVLALWEQTGIAASNLDNARYFDDTKEELNRVTFNYFHKGKS